jgi:FMN phosphatase YigB (HAD superfamily)
MAKKIKRFYLMPSVWATVTNSQVFSFNRLNKKFHIDGFFDAIIKSFEVNCVKPNKIMFQMILDKLGENRDTTIMVGNSFKEDVRPAEHFGMLAVLVDRENKHPLFERRIPSLNELNKFLN